MIHHGPSPSGLGPHTQILSDRRTDLAMMSGSTSKTRNPAQDRDFWIENDQPRDTGSAAYHKSCHHYLGDRNYMLGGGPTSIAGDTSEGSAADPMTRSIDEIPQLDEDSLRKIQDRVTKAFSQ